MDISVTMKQLPKKKKRTHSIKTAKTTLRGKSLDVLHHMTHDHGYKVTIRLGYKAAIRLYTLGNHEETVA